MPTPIDVTVERLYATIQLQLIESSARKKALLVNSATLRMKVTDPYQFVHSPDAWALSLAMHRCEEPNVGVR